MPPLRFIFAVMCAFAATAPTFAADPTPAGRFVAVGYGLRTLTSADGVTWEHDREDVDKGKDKDFLLRGVTAGKGKLVAVGGSSTSRILVSTDGREWADRSVKQNWLGDVAFGNDRFVAVGYHKAMASADGEKWSDPVPLREASWRRVAFGNGKFVAVGASATGADADGFRAVTADGAKWATAKLPDRLVPRDVAFGNGRFVVVGSKGFRESSADGEKWEHRATGADDEDLQSVAWAGTRFVAAGNKGAYTSADGVTWEKAALRMPSRFAFGAGKFAGCGTGKFSHSADGVAWKPSKASGTLQITAIIFVPSP